MFSGTAQVSHQICRFFFVSSVCLLARVTMVDKNKAVVCCLLATSVIMLSEKKKRKRKMWSKKWYLKRNISCDAHLRNELLETDVPWDEAIVVSAGKLRKLWDSLSELRSSLCERQLERTVLRPALLPSKLRSLLSFFRQVWRHTVKSLLLTESVWRPLHGSSVASTFMTSYTPGNAGCSMHYRPAPVLIIKQVDPVTHSFIPAFDFNSGLSLRL